MYLPLALDIRYCPNCPKAQSLEPCAEYCVLSRSSNQPFPLSYPADSSGGDQEVQQPFGASRQAQPLEYGTGAMQYSSPCIYENLDHLVTGVRNMWQAVQPCPALGGINTSVDELNLVHTSTYKLQISMY